ncbi:MAG: hypothetical protein P4L81_05355 [Candidatus Pacebacteria bacterium]|nr:hypothetical protein [Candidatus Paceibacterota bacterium]
MSFSYPRVVVAVFASIFASLGMAGSSYAQSISAQDAPVTSASEATACQQEIATAASRGYPDTQSIIIDQGTLQFEDHCVAAVFNPAAASLGPHNPGSYMCVGKSAKVIVSSIGVITEAATPDPAVPAGSCLASACDAPGGSGCMAATNVTSPNSAFESSMPSAPTSVTPDQGITDVSVNSDAGIASQSGNSVTSFQSDVGSVSGETSAMGEAQPVSWTQPSETFTSPAESPASVQPETSANTVTDVSATPDTSAATTDVSPPQASAQSTNTTMPDQTIAQPTVSDAGTSPNSSGIDLSHAQTQSQSWIDRAGSTLMNDGIKVVNDVRSFLGMQPLNMGAPAVEPSTMGVRG